MNKLLVKMEWLLIFVLSICLILGGILVHNALAEMETARRYDFMQRISGHLIVAAGWQAIERGSGATIIGSGSVPSPEILARFNDAGKKGDEEVRAALKELGELLALLSNEDLRLSRDSWQSVYKTLLESRARVSARVISKADWVNTATLNIDREITLWDTVFAPHDDRERVLYLNTIVRSNVAVVNEYAGRERANLGNLIASNLPIPPDLLETLKSYRSIVDHAAGQIWALKSYSNSPSELVAAIYDFDKEFMGSYQGLREKVYAAGLENRPYPVSATQWFEGATKAINTGLRVSEVIGSQSAKATEEISANSRRAIKVTVGLFTSAIVISAFVLIFVRRTIFIPINRVINENARLAGVAMHAADAVVITDAAGLIEYVNPAFEKITGYGLDEVRGKNPRILKSGRQEGAYYKELWDSINAGKVWRGQITNRRKDGSFYDEEMTISPISDGQGKIINFVAVKRDITELKAIAEELSRFFNLVPDMVCVASAEGHFLKLNPMWQKVLGYTEQELLAIPFIDLIHPDDRDATMKEVEKQVMGAPTVGFVNRYRCKDGGYKWLEWMATPSPDRKQLFAAARDITERKLMEQAIMNSEKLSSIGTFVAGVAHEINNPLTAIKGFAEELKVDESLSPKGKRGLDIILEQTKRTVKIVQSLLHFSRSSSGEKASVEVTKSLEDIVSLQEYPLRSNNIEVRKNYSREHLRVSGSSSQLQQVFLNIITNGIHAMSKASGRGILYIATERTKGEVRITFENDGPPIPTHVMGRIFDPFYTTKAPGEGTGLGLAISFGIVAEHGGRLWAENVGHSGVRFVISLPIDDNKAGKAVVAKESFETDISGLEILIAEDEKAVSEWLSNFLSRKGAKVRVASNGREAVELMSGNRYDLVLSDVKMPEMDGLQLAAWWHENRPEERGRFIIMTGTVEDEATNFRRIHGCEIVQKPFEENELFAAIRKALDYGMPELSADKND